MDEDPSHYLEYALTHARISNVRLLLEAGKEEAGTALPRATASLRARSSEPWHPELFDKLWDSLRIVAGISHNLAATYQCIPGMQAMARHVPDAELDNMIQILPNIALKGSQIQLSLLEVSRREDAAKQGEWTLAKVTAKHGEASVQAAMTRWQLGSDRADCV